MWLRIFDRFGAIGRNEEKPSIIVDIAKAMLKNKIVIFALIYLVVFYVIGIAACIAGLFDLSLTPYGYEEIDYSAVREGPSWVHWFGTDLIGRDIFTRVIFPWALALNYQFW